MASVGEITCPSESQSCNQRGSQIKACQCQIETEIYLMEGSKQHQEPKQGKKKKKQKKTGKGVDLEGLGWLIEMKKQ